jgi:hypothetical protein
MVQSRLHLIVTLRTKTEYVSETKDGTTAPRLVGLAPLQREGLDYECGRPRGGHGSASSPRHGRSGTPVLIPLKPLALSRGERKQEGETWPHEANRSSREVGLQEQQSGVAGQRRPRATMSGKSRAAKDR